MTKFTFLLLLLGALAILFCYERIYRKSRKPFDFPNDKCKQPRGQFSLQSGNPFQICNGVDIGGILLPFDSTFDELKSLGKPDIIHDEKYLAWENRKLWGGFSASVSWESKHQNKFKIEPLIKSNGVENAYGYSFEEINIIFGKPNDYFLYQNYFPRAIWYFSGSQIMVGWSERFLKYLIFNVEKVENKN